MRLLANCENCVLRGLFKKLISDAYSTRKTALGKILLDMLGYQTSMIENSGAVGLDFHKILRR